MGYVAGCGGDVGFTGLGELPTITRNGASNEDWAQARAHFRSLGLGYAEIEAQARNYIVGEMVKARRRQLEALSDVPNPVTGISERMRFTGNYDRAAGGADTAASVAAQEEAIAAGEAAREREAQILEERETKALALRQENERFALERAAERKAAAERRAAAQVPPPITYSPARPILISDSSPPAETTAARDLVGGSPGAGEYAVPIGIGAALLYFLTRRRA